MRMIRWYGWAAALAALWMLSGCESTGKLRIRRTRDGQDLAGYRVKSLTGIRDGEKLKSQLVLADNNGTLTMHMSFQVGVPTKLESGVYQWTRADVKDTLTGTIAADAVTFQGGQDSPPSLGGTFELLGGDVGVSLYQVRVPATRMEPPEKTPFSLP